MSSRTLDQCLLYGAWARQNGWIDRETLTAIVRRWLENPSLSMEQLLIDQAGLSADQLRELDQLCGGEESQLTADCATTLAADALLNSLQAALKRADSSKQHGGVDELDDSLTTFAPSSPTTFPRADLSNAVDESSRRYEIIRLHAEGGLGQVFLAMDLELGREVALKQIRAERADQQEMQSRFMREAEITGRLEHPGVVPVYGLGADELGRPYYAMRWIRGKSLKEAIDAFHQSPEPGRSRSLQLRNLLQRFVTVCNSIEYAHSRGVLHRDIKPDNVMLGKYGETLVVDWGLAKTIGRDEDHTVAGETTLYPESGDELPPTQFGSAVGTPAYMSPEQAAGRHNELTLACDVYSLGATLYQILTGQPPHTGHTLVAILQSVEQGDFPRPRRVARWVPRLLEAVCLKAMALDISDRYASASELGTDLERWLADEPVAAHPENTPERLVRWMRSNRSLVVSACLLLVLASIATAVSVVLSQRAAHHQQQRLLGLQSAATANEELALAELQGGRFQSALTACRLGQDQTRGEPTLALLHNRLEERGVQIERLVRFEEAAQRAERHSVFEEDDHARIECEAALQSLGVFDHGDWWAHLPDEDLSPKQQDQLCQQAYFQLLLLAHMYCKDVVLNFLDPRSKLAADKVLRIAHRAQAFRPAQSLQFLSEFCELRLGRSKTFPKIPDVAPRNAVDGYFVAAALFVVSRSPHVATVLQARDRFPNTLKLARDAYLETSHQMVDHYWTSWTAGYCDLLLEDYASARRAFSHCIALRPNEFNGFGARCDATLQLVSLLNSRQEEVSNDGGDSPQQFSTSEDLLLLALRDAKKGVEVAPDVYFAHWYLGDVFMAMGRSREAVGSYRKAIDLGPAADRSPRHQFMNVHRENLVKTEQRAAELTKQHPENAEYWVLLAEVKRVLGKRQHADAAAAQALQRQSNLPRALAIRGEAALARGRHKSAKDQFERALRLNAEDYVAARGLAQTFEALGLSDKTRDAYQRASDCAVSPWHIAQSHGGRCRALLLLNQPTQAIAACRKALLLDGRLDIQPLKQLGQQHGAETFLKALEKMRPISPLDQPPTAQANRVRVAPLMNGGFELGFSSYWSPEQPGQPIWWNQQGCQSTAESVTEVSRQGERSLHIHRQSPAGPGVTASVQQVIPVVINARYRVMVWAKAKELGPQGVRIIAAAAEENQVVVTLDQGTYDWKSFQGEFRLNASEAAIRIVSHDRGEAWIDGIGVEKLEDLEPEKRKLGEGNESSRAAQPD